jgi:sugar O-acyltransferase (sialic acid O-acetyltransferase NeuD family)
MSPQIGLLGAGGQAAETQSYLDEGAVLFRAVSADVQIDNSTVSVESPSDELRRMPVIAAVGSPWLRRRLTEIWPGDQFHTLIARGARVGRDVVIGAGTVVAPGAILTTRIAVGRHVLVNVGVTVAHDVVVGDFATIGPGAHIGGNSRLGAGCLIGIGAVVRDGIVLADGVVVGAGAVVVEDIPTPNSIAYGNPARIHGTNEGWARGF